MEVKKYKSLEEFDQSKLLLAVANHVHWNTKCSIGGELLKGAIRESKDGEKIFINTEHYECKQQQEGLKEQGSTHSVDIPVEPQSNLSQKDLDALIDF